MTFGAALMVGWTVLLVWAAAKPVNRRAVDDARGGWPHVLGVPRDGIGILASATSVGLTGFPGGAAGWLCSRLSRRE